MHGIYYSVIAEVAVMYSCRKKTKQQPDNKNKTELSYTEDRKQYVITIR